MTRKRKQAATRTAPPLLTPELSARQILQATPLAPKLAIILGSGFDAVHTAVESAVELPFSQLPGFLPTGIDGHRGKLIIGLLSTVPVMVLCGRAHYYEGYSLAE